jgi:hypothetical protein
MAINTDQDLLHGVVHASVENGGNTPGIHDALSRHLQKSKTWNFTIIFLRLEFNPLVMV